MAFKIFTYNSVKQIVSVDEKGKISQLTPNSFEVKRGYQAPNAQFFAEECLTNLLQALHEDHFNSSQMRAEFHESIILEYTHGMKERTKLETLLEYKMFHEAFHFISSASGAMNREHFAEGFCYHMAKFIEKNFETAPCTWKVCR